MHIGATTSHVLLLPGMMCDARQWQAQSAALSPEYEVRIGAMDGGDTVAAIGRAILKDAPTHFALAGLSMGGIVAMEMWRQAPERIERLALLDTNFRADSAERQHLRNTQISRVQNGELETILRDELKPNYLAKSQRNNTQLLDEVLAMGLSLGAEIFVAQSRALRDRRDSTDTLASISCPTLVLCGDEDTLCPAALHREMAAAIPGAELTILPSCGHLSSMEAPQAVSDALQKWLTIN